MLSGANGKKRSVADESSDEKNIVSSNCSLDADRKDDSATDESEAMKKLTAPKAATVVTLGKNISKAKLKPVVILSAEKNVSTPEFPAKLVVPKRRRSVIAKGDEEEDSSSAAVSSGKSSSSSGSSSSSNSDSDSSDVLLDGESTNSFSSGAAPRKKKLMQELSGPRRSVGRKQDIISEDREIQMAMRVWVDGSLPGDFFKITATQTYCIECLKDEDNSKLVVCRRCSGRVHLECLKHSQGRMRTCRDCYRWPHEIQSVLTWRKPEMPVQQRADDDEGLLLEYYIKWKSRPHMADAWVTGRWLYRISYQRYLAFQRKLMPSLRVSEVVQPEWLELERVVAIEKVEGQQQYLIKWHTMGYEDATWCTHKELENLLRFDELVMKRKTVTKTVRPEKREFVQLKGAPPFLSPNKKLFNYQLDGLNWMLYSWSTSTNIVLADEMGLGKTAQTVSFIGALETAGWRPALVIAPLSTLTHWEREFAEWTPHLNVVMFTGSPEGRDVIRQYELYSGPDSREPRFDVILTSFEGGLIETKALRRFHWALMVVDEGQRLKNRESKLFGALKDFRTDHRLLLSGTPLQNNMSELFNMLEFLQLPQFKGKDRLDIHKEFEDLREKDQVTKLHEILRPHFLRRLKKDVLDFLPPKAEIVVPLSLSPLQQEYYKAILQKKLPFLRSVSRSSLLNVAMELRKCADHPYLCMQYLPAVIPGPEQAERLINASSKLGFLHAMLPKLKAKGHRVLIFSQLTMMLDILEDYLKMHHYKWSRIDGAVPAADRQPIIDEFNEPNSEIFCMLLSTRACRLGINLATADTVILYDSDWNPHNDIQAFSRVHRIGQKSKVAVYRLIVMQSIEEGIIRTARRKLVLDHVVVQRMHTQLQTGELDNILKIGAKELFEGVTPVITYDDGAMGKLLDRTHILADAKEEPQAAPGQEHYLGNLSNARVWEQAPASSKSSRETDPEYWAKLLAGRVKETHDETLGKGQRKRKQLSYIEDRSESSKEEEKSKKEDAKVGNNSEDEIKVIKKTISKKKLSDDEDAGWSDKSDEDDSSSSSDAAEADNSVTPSLAPANPTLSHSTALVAAATARAFAASQASSVSDLQSVTSAHSSSASSLSHQSFAPPSASQHVIPKQHGTSAANLLSVCSSQSSAEPTLRNDSARMAEAARLWDRQIASFLPLPPPKSPKKRFRVPKPRPVPPMLPPLADTPFVLAPYVPQPLETPVRQQVEPMSAETRAHMATIKQKEDELTRQAIASNQLKSAASNPYNKYHANAKAAPVSVPKPAALSKSTTGGKHAKMAKVAAPVVAPILPVLALGTLRNDANKSSPMQSQFAHAAQGGADISKPTSTATPVAKATALYTKAMSQQAPLTGTLSQSVRPLQQFLPAPPGLLSLSGGRGGLALNLPK